MDDAVLHVVHAPAAPKVDVVFVHGLDGHHRNTWMTPGDESSYWPAWLCTDFPAARVFSFAYPTVKHAWFQRALPLRSLAGNLVHQLALQGVGQRPVVWVVHSMGGLVVKALLVDTENDRCVRLWHATQALCFMGTPHHGADMAETLCSCLGGLARTGQSNLEDLRSNAPALLALNRRLGYFFHSMPVASRPAVVVYRETQPTAGIMIVQKDSADPKLEGAEVVDLPKDHIDLCKPQSRKDAPHQWLLSQLRAARPVIGVPGMRPIAPILLAYRHEADTARTAKIHQMIEWLKRMGVPTVSDQDFPLGSRAPKGGFKSWATKALQDAPVVLMLGGPATVKCFEPATGAASGDEAFQGAYPKRSDFEADPDRFIPILLDGDPEDYLPAIVRDWWNGQRYPSCKEQLLESLCCDPHPRAGA